MFPGFSKNYPAYRGLLHAELVGYLLLGVTLRSQSTNLLNLLIVQFRTRVILPVEVIATALLVHIVHVVLMRSSEKMQRIKTAPIITAMKNTETCRDRSDRTLVDHPVQEEFGLPAAKSDTKIAILVESPISFQTRGSSFVSRAKRPCDQFLCNIVVGLFRFSGHAIIISPFYAKVGAEYA